VGARKAFVPVFEGEVYELYFFNGNLEDPVVLGTWNYNVYPVIDGNKWSAKITNYLANHDWNSFRILAEFLTKFL
jgi:hypothetical protein